jgi:uncharacterized cupredoxin-like copper-binding protein
MTRRGLLIVVVIASLLVLGSMVAVGLTGGFDQGTSDIACRTPTLPGTTVHVSLDNMGSSSMMGGGMMGGHDLGVGVMSLRTDTASVPAGTVSFAASNLGSIDHELLVLPLSDSAQVGARQPGSDGKVNEDTSLGEASKTCGAGAGEGIAPGATSWVTLQLSPGRYELICNLPGHYAAGMHELLEVR